jgi:hypothetical protein
VGVTVPVIDTAFAVVVWATGAVVAAPLISQIAAENPFRIVL